MIVRALQYVERLSRRTNSAELAPLLYLYYTSKVCHLLGCNDVLETLFSQASNEYFISGPNFDVKEKAERNIGNVVHINISNKVSCFLPIFKRNGTF